MTSEPHQLNPYQEAIKYIIRRKTSPYGPHILLIPILDTWEINPQQEQCCRTAYQKITARSLEWDLVIFYGDLHKTV